MSASDIAANNRAFERAVGAGDVDAIAALLAPDVMALPPDSAMATGKAAVSQLWGSVIREHGLRDCRITTDTLDVVGDVAIEVGRATVTLGAAGGPPATERIKFVVVWKRLDGKWLLHRDIWNADQS
jgi:uncharacterized protein (TIGR02246 family)